MEVISCDGSGHKQNRNFGLLKERGMLGCKLIDTPMDPNVKLGMTENDNLVDRGRYQHSVGKLIYLSHTRLDIAFSVSCVSQFMH